MLVLFAGTGITRTSCLDRSGARSRQRHRMTGTNLFFCVSTNSGSRARTVWTIGVTYIFPVRHDAQAFRTQGYDLSVGIRICKKKRARR